MPFGEGWGQVMLGFMCQDNEPCGRVRTVSLSQPQLQQALVDFMFAERWFEPL